jgi:hypothetical protein
MAKSFKANKTKRDGGRFLALPHAVIDSPSYQALGFAARALLIDIARQYTGSNNGRLVACAKAMRPRGWNSNGTVSRALKELQASGLLIQTRLGMKPNRAAWFALGWQALDETSGLDIDPRTYRTGQYKVPISAALVTFKLHPKQV